MSTKRNHVYIPVIIQSILKDHKYIQLISLIFSILFSTSLCAWNAWGHYLAAQIAYDHLNPAERKLFQQDNQGLALYGKHDDLILSAVWLDEIRAIRWNNTMKPLSKLHYIGLPYSPDRPIYQRIDKMNAVWALTMAKKVLSDKASSIADRTIAVRILWHVAADIHQPMHCIKFISARHPRSDRGGNLYYLGPQSLTKNLHAYWDIGGGALIQPPRISLRRALKLTAKKLEARWPCQATQDLNPRNWANESYQLAINVAYQIPEDTTPSVLYQNNAQSISEERIVLAGCRLAALAKEIYRKRAATSDKS